jgi:hypothetical protein
MLWTRFLHGSIRNFRAGRRYLLRKLFMNLSKIVMLTSRVSLTASSKFRVRRAATTSGFLTGKQQELEVGGLRRSRIR